MEVEGDIIKEMMEIVAKRDSLITLLEEDRLRCIKSSRSPVLSVSDEESLLECPNSPFIVLIILLIAYVVAGVISEFVCELHV